MFWLIQVFFHSVMSEQQKIIEITNQNISSDSDCQLLLCVFSMITHNGVSHNSVLVVHSHPTSRPRRSSRTTLWPLYETILSCSTPSTQWAGDPWWFAPTLTTSTHLWPWTRWWLLTATTRSSSWAQVTSERLQIWKLSFSTDLFAELSKMTSLLGKAANQ